MNTDYSPLPQNRSTRHQPKKDNAIIFCIRIAEQCTSYLSPDISGEFDVGHAELIYTSGAFSLITKEQSNFGVDKYQHRKIVKFMASSGNSIYGTSNNVNVPSAYALMIIKV